MAAPSRAIVAVENSRRNIMRALGILLSIGVVVMLIGAGSAQEKARNKGKIIRQDGLARLQAELAKRIKSAPARVMKKSGLAGAMGGAHVKVFSDKPQTVLMPIPQLADGQVPICYFISSTPADAVTEFRLRRRDDGNVIVDVHLAGKKQDVRIAWSSVVLLAPSSITPNRAPADPYFKATACVQSRADEITKLATKTWPKTGKRSDFAANIQRYIRGMKRVDRPRSLDAVGILKSGENSICTGNANLAAALMRSKGIACRSMAVIPPISQRLEMHRIVEFFEKGRWVPFDPSSLHTDIPTKPWQNITMAKTTTQDEKSAMKPRMGVMVGCPYGQEIELLMDGSQAARRVRDHQGSEPPGVSGLGPIFGEGHPKPRSDQSRVRQVRR
jgi:hypothetical protein